jgi:hypothetical protein
MTGISRFPAANAFASFIDAADPVYGTGSDGSVTISTNTTLSSDKYYYNLEINANTNLITAGYRVFVKNILTLRNGSLIGFTTGSNANGSIAGGAAANTAVTNSLGGNSATQIATPPTVSNGGTGDKTTQSGYWYQPTQSSKGYVITATQTTPLFLRGGAGGASVSGTGGGVVILNARYISCDANTVNASISAPGTAGSGGGGGGVIIITSAQASLPANVSTNVAGGTSCANGTVIYSQLV